MKDKKKELSDHKIKLIVMAVLTILVAITIPFVVKIVNNIIIQNQTPSDPPPPDEPPVEPPKTPTLTVPTSITIDKLTTNYKFEYTTTDLGEYQVTITIQDTSIATLDTNNYIIPSAVGTTTITTEINCEPKITKITTLSITDAVTDLAYLIKDISNQTPEKLFVGKTYTIEICENADMSNPPNLGYLEEYISDFEFVNKTDNISTFTFKIIKAGDFSFYYNEKYCQKHINLTSYVFPSDIDVTFSNINFENNKSNLYLFDVDCLAEANNDGYFNQTEFEINIPTNVYDEIEYEINGTSVTLYGNKITAICAGKSIITFISKVSAISKSFEIDVLPIEPTSIVFNSSTYNIGEEIDISTKANTSFDFVYTIAPNYAYGEINIETSSNITYTDNKIILTNTENGSVFIKFNDTTILSCNIIFLPDYKIDISLNGEYSFVTFDNDNLKITLGDDNSFILDCTVINSATNLPESIKLNVEILDTTIISSSTGDGYVAIKNGTLILTALSAGNTKLIFNSTEYNLHYEIKIEIS